MWLECIGVGQSKGDPVHCANPCYILISTSWLLANLFSSLNGIPSRQYVEKFIHIRSDGPVSPILFACSSELPRKLWHCDGRRLEFSPVGLVCTHTMILADDAREITKWYSDTRLSLHGYSDMFHTIGDDESPRQEVQGGKDETYTGPTRGSRYHPLVIRDMIAVFSGTMRIKGLTVTSFHMNLAKAFVHWASNFIKAAAISPSV